MNVRRSSRSTRGGRSSKAQHDLSVLPEADENASQIERPMDTQTNSAPPSSVCASQINSQSTLKERKPSAASNKKILKSKENSKDVTQGLTATRTEEPEESDNSHSVLLRRVIDNPKGQKTQIKRLYTERLQVKESVSEDLMSSAIWCSHFMAVPEGYKLGAHFLHRLGLDRVEKELTIVIQSRKSFPKSHLRGFGESLIILWKLVEGDEEKVSEATGVEKLWTFIVRNSLLIEGVVGTRYREITYALDEVDRAKFDPFLLRILGPVLAKYLTTVCSAVRLEAAKYVLRFFPLYPADSDKRTDLILNMMRDPCIEIRCIAVIEAMSFINTFWSVLPSDFIRRVMECAVDEMSGDSVATVRSAVFKGLRQLVDCAGGVNILDHSLRCVCPPGINDKNDKVRFDCLRLLNSIKNHRYIRFFDCVEVDELLSRFEVETYPLVREELVKLVYNSYHPKGSGPDKKLVRLGHMIKKGGRHAALYFHRLIYKLGLIDIQDAVNLLKFMMLSIYMRWKHGAQFTLSDSNCSMLNDTVSTMTSISSFNADSNAPEIDVNSDDFDRDMILFECTVALWKSLRKDLEQHPALENLMDGLGTKFFRRMYEVYRNTPLIGACLVLGGLLKQTNLEIVANDCLKTLMRGNVSEQALESYLNFVSEWKLVDLLMMITKDLQLIPDLVMVDGEKELALNSPARKKPRTRAVVDNPVEVVDKALTYLRLTLANQKVYIRILQESLFYVERIFEILEPVQDAIMEYLAMPPDSFDAQTGKVLAEAFQMRVLINNKLSCAAELACRDARRTEDYIADYNDAIVWVSDVLFPRMNELLNEVSPLWPNAFLFCQYLLVVLPSQFEMCESILTMAKEKRESGGGTRQRTESRAERIKKRNAQQKEKGEGAETGEPEATAEKIVLSFVNSVLDLLSAMVNKEAPSKQLVLVMEMAQALLFKSQYFKQLHSEIEHCMVKVACALPDWELYVDDELMADDISRNTMGLLKAVFEKRSVGDLSKEKVMKSIVRCLLNERINSCEESHNISDPRELCFEVCPIVQLLLHKCILKSSVMKKLYFDCLSGIVGASGRKNFIPDEQHNLDSLVYRLGAAAQLAYLSNESVVRKQVKKDQAALPRNSEEVRSILSILHKRMGELVRRNGETVQLADGSVVTAEFRDDSIRSQVYELIEFDEVMAFE